MTLWFRDRIKTSQHPFQTEYQVYFQLEEHQLHKNRVQTWEQEINRRKVRKKAQCKLVMNNSLLVEKNLQKVVEEV